MKRRYMQESEINEFLSDSLGIHGDKARWVEIEGAPYDGVCMISSADFPHITEELIESEVELYTGNRCIQGVDPRIEYIEAWEGLTCLVTVKIPYGRGAWFG